VAFSDSSVVYSFHLDLYFQTHAAFPPNDPPPTKSTTFYPLLGHKKQDESDDEDSVEEEDEEEDEEEEENKNFSHWFEVCARNQEMIFFLY
jgi:hypothetical protein